MKYCTRLCVLVVFLACFLGATALRADEDSPDYRNAVNPGFQVSGKTYGQFQTPVYELEKALDNLLISVDIAKAPAALVRSYARFQSKQTQRWSQYQPFEGECHFADINPVIAYQLLFVIRDPNMGTTQVKRFTVQGRNLGADLMASLSQKPAPFEGGKVWPKPAIVTRDGWKARPPKSAYTLHQPQKIILHHSWSPKQAQYAGASTIRGIQNYHMDDAATGWMDIGYHFLIGPDGVIYQGRPETAVGAHCPPNTNMVGICLIGDYDPNEDLLNPKIETSLLNLYSWLSSTYSIDPRVSYFGHRNFSTKSCPGDIAYNRLPTYIAQVWKNIGTGLK